MKPDDKTRTHCGSDARTANAAVALTCPVCGCPEPPPKSTRRRGDLATDHPLRHPSRPSGRTPPAPVVALVDVQPGSRQLLEGLCVAHGRRVICCSPATTSAEETTLLGAELLVIEADRGGLAVTLARRLRGRAPAVPIAIVLTSWSESEADAQSAAEFVIHAPLREREINRLLERIASNGPSFSSSPAATTYRDRVAS